MPIAGQCPGCKASIKLSDSFCGKKVRCVKCGRDFQIHAPIKSLDKGTEHSINLDSSSGKMPKAPSSAKLPKLSESGIRPKPGESGKTPKPGSESGRIAKPDSASGKIAKPGSESSKTPKPGSLSGKTPKPDSAPSKAPAPMNFEADKGSGGGAMVVIIGLAVLFLCVLLPLGGGVAYWLTMGDSAPEVAKVTEPADNKVPEPPAPRIVENEDPNKDKKKEDPSKDKKKEDPNKDKKKEDPSKDKKKEDPAKDKKKEDPSKDKKKEDPAKDKNPPKDKNPRTFPKEEPKPPLPPPDVKTEKPEPIIIARQKYTDEELTKILDDIKGEDPEKKVDAVDRLTNAEPIPARRTEIARLLEPMLDPKEMNEGLRRSATRALGTWGDAQSVPVLVARLPAEEKDLLVKALAVEALGNLKESDPEVVAASLKDLLLRFYAARSLRAMGARAEPAVLKLLQDKDAAVRAAACKVLAEIGTKASVPALQNVAKDPNPHIAAAANEALKALGNKS
jgi:hypothetical protein